MPREGPQIAATNREVPTAHDTSNSLTPNTTISFIKATNIYQHPNRIQAYGKAVVRFSIPHYLAISYASQRWGQGHTDYCNNLHTCLGTALASKRCDHLNTFAHIHQA